MAEPNYKTLYVEDLGGEIQYPSNYSQDQVNQLVQKARSMLQKQSGSNSEASASSPDKEALYNEVLNEIGYSTAPIESDQETNTPSKKSSSLQGILEGFRKAAPFNKQITAYSGALRREVEKSPAKELAKSALMGPAVRLIYGLMGGDDFNKSYDKERKLLDTYEKQVSEDHPILTEGTKAAASIPWYLTGTNALSKAPGLVSLLEKSPTLAKTLIGGLTGSGLGYSQTGKTDNIPLDFALGAGGELIGAGVQGASKKMQGIPKWMMNKVFKPSASEVEARALKGAPTLGEQVLERKLSGSTDDFMRMAADKKSEIGKLLDEILSEKSKIIKKSNRVYYPKNKSNFYSDISKEPFDTKKIFDLKKISSETYSPKEIKNLIKKEDPLFPFIPESLSKDKIIIPIEKTVPTSLLPKEPTGFVSEIKNLSKKDVNYPHSFKAIINSKGKINPASNIIDKNIVLDELKSAMGPWEKVDKKEAVTHFKDLMEIFKKGPDLTPLQAQSKKTALYDILQKSFGKDVVPYAADADMAKAIGLKKAIEKIAPEVTPLNKEWAFFNKIYQSALNTGKKEASSAVLPLKDELLGTALTMKYGPGEGLASLFGSQMAQSPKFLSKNAVRLKSLLDFLQKSRGVQSLAPAISSLNSSLSE